MTVTDLLDGPNAVGRDGIHLSAQLRVDAMQLRDHQIPWAAVTMEQAALRIVELETMIVVNFANKFMAT